MKLRTVFLVIAALLLLVLVAAGIWIVSVSPGAGGATVRDLISGTNLGLDVRYNYNAGVFAPAPFDPRAEYPFQLDADGWGLYGKRIRGIGSLLTKAPEPMLFDFVGSQHAEVFEDWYKLERTLEHYEDDYLNGRLVLHNTLAYRLTPESTGWPAYFPEGVKQGPEAHLNGWVFFSDEDLFYFYAISPRELNEEQLANCRIVLESIEFGVVLGSRPDSFPPEESGGEPGGPAAGDSAQTEPSADEAQADDQPAGR